jgi:hypothetical protein
LAGTSTVSFAADGAAIGADQMGPADRIAVLFALGRIVHTFYLTKRVVK